MTNIKHVFFDLDHTIWDFEANSREALMELFTLYKNDIKDINFHDFMKVYKDINELYWEQYRHNRIDKETLRVGRFKDVFKEFGKNFQFQFLNQFAKDYLARSPYKTNLFPGAFETLDYLKGKYKLHIITNGFQEVQYIKLATSKLASYFDVVICADEVGVKKPNPEIFEIAMASSNAKASESIMIGDSVEADVLAALAVGMKAAWFNPFQASHKNDLLSISQLSDLKLLL
ncbi:MAG: YjjG family noncanonical pyrimidine nucleotidase [Crocinitomicaceae bacterium]